ncbi:MAG: homocysteine S-methyltransferase family protein [Halanaerobiaceae bacterium]
MSRVNILHKIKESVIIGDGAMGTMVQKLLEQSSKSPELIMLEKPEIIEEIHSRYISAGANLIETNTFGANRLKLKAIDMADKTREINELAVKLARQAAGENVLVAGSIGPTGKMMKPHGQLSAEKGREVFLEQISYLVDAGVDVICIETMSDLAEIKAALLAAQDFEIPVIAQMTYTENGYTLTGTPPEIVAIVLEGLGADIIGVNCVAGLKNAIPIVEKISTVTDLPISVFANAGMPVCVRGKTTYPESSQEYVQLLEELLNFNVRILGGCCGTSPEYIKAIEEKIKIIKLNKDSEFSNSNKLYLAGSRNYLELTGDSPVYIIGEKLNPTGRKDIKKALKEEDWSYLKKLARDQIEAGARLLDVNIGIPGIDKKAVMKELINELQIEIAQPLVLDSDNPKVLEAGLQEYIGKPLINSVNGNQSSMDKVLPLVKKYGAAVIGLTLDDDGIPSTVEGRMKIARRIVEEAEKYGIERKNIFIDTLTLTTGSDQEQVMVTLETLKKVKEELGVKTTLGASNISHGMPEREIINQVFLNMAIGYGLDLPIADPFADNIQEQIRTANLITNRDKNGQEFINYFGKKSRDNKESSINDRESGTGEKQDVHKTVDDLSMLGEAVINGDSSGIISLAEKALENNRPQDILNKILIPSIQKVGDLYDEGTYFLPQLLKSAETMQTAFEFLKSKMSVGEEHQSKASMILATVKGDIHDIGKNIVKTIFLNHGYEIIDLGANVDTDLIVETALEKEVDFVGLSSLMTTTLEEMRNVVKKLNEKNYQGTIMIGGAVTSQEFADEIGADVYARDALDGVKKANALLNI